MNVQPSTCIAFAQTSQLTLMTTQVKFRSTTSSHPHTSARTLSYDAKRTALNTTMAPANSSSSLGNELRLDDIPLQLKPLLEGLKSLSKSAEHADLTITCKGQRWSVHKLCLVTQSDFFRKSLSGRFREGQEGTIHLNDDDPIVIESLIHYLYHFEYVEFAKERSGLDSISMDIKMFIVADKYFVASLRTIAARNFEKHAGAVWNTQAFFDGVKEVYGHFGEDGSNELKDAIISIVKAHTKELFSTENGYSCFLAVLGRSSGFGKDVAIALAVGFPSGKCYKCPECKGVFSIHSDMRRLVCPNSTCQQAAENRAWWAKYEVK